MQEQRAEADAPRPLILTVTLRGPFHSPDIQRVGQPIVVKVPVFANKASVADDIKNRHARISSCTYQSETELSSRRSIGSFRDS